MTMVKLTAMLPLVIFFSVYAQTEKCKCERASADQTTSWGKQNLIIREERAFKWLHGRVVIGDKPLAGVLVEVYNNPDGLLMDWKEREAMRNQQQRVAACVTGPDGEFCFPDIPAGKYEVRCSKPVEWDPTSVYIIVAPKNPQGTKSKVIVPMHVSQ